MLLFTGEISKTYRRKQYIVSDISSNKSSTSKGLGHKNHYQRCSSKEINAETLFNNRKLLLLLLFGTILHTVQDFYSHSNWVENWNDTGFSNNIPTWDEAKEFTEKGNPQAINILNNTYTHYYKIKYPSNGTLSHDELNKDSRYSSEGSKISRDGKSTLYELTEQVAQRATYEWIIKFKKWVNNNTLWRKIQKDNDFNNMFAKEFQSEFQEEKNLFQAAGKWDRETRPNVPSLIINYFKWHNRYANVSKIIFSNLLIKFHAFYMIIYQHLITNDKYLG
jgi:hypothetical protein